MKLLCIISGILLLLAIPTGWPYAYYGLLRWIILISSIIVAWNFHKSQISSWVFIFGAIAFLFNPIMPIHLNKQSWISIDFISSILFFLATYSVKKSKV